MSIESFHLQVSARLGGGMRHVQLLQAIGIEGPSLVHLLGQLRKAGLIESHGRRA